MTTTVTKKPPRSRTSTGPATPTASATEAPTRCGGHLAEDDNGDLLLPAWGHPHREQCPGGWWNRRLDLRRPTHWLPWLRSRLTRTLQWVEAL